MPSGTVRRSGAKGQDAPDAGGDHLVGDLLSYGCWCRDDADLDAFAADDVPHFRNRRDFDTADVLADNAMVDIEKSCRPEPQTTEGLVVRQGPAEMADAGDTDFPMLLQADDFHDLLA